MRLIWQWLVATLKFVNIIIVPKWDLLGSPARLDGKPLTLFDTMIIGISADELIKRGNISPYHYYAPDLDIDFSKVKKTGGDYNNQQLGNVMNSKKIYRRYIEIL